MNLTLNRKSILIVAAVFAIAISFTAITVAALMQQQQISQTGVITGSQGLAIYKDSAGLQYLSNITWPAVSQGGSVTYDIYIKNTGNTAESYSFVTSNWAPANASTLLSISWNAPVSAAAGSMTKVTLTLTAGADTGSLSSFSSLMTVSAAKYP